MENEDSRKMLDAAMWWKTSMETQDSDRMDHQLQGIQVPDVLHTEPPLQGGRPRSQVAAVREDLFREHPR